MKKITTDFKKGFVKVKIENPDDLWYLSQVIEKGDLVSGKTLRKIKIGGEEDRKTKVVKKPVFIKIKVEKIEFSDSQTLIKILGTIEESSDEIPKGEHHSFNIEVGTELKIEKKWLNFQIDKLKEAFEQKSSKILITVFDREEAYFALMKKFGVDVLSHIQGNVANKRVEKSNTSNFYAEIIKQVEDYDKRYLFDNIIMASPAFWKDELLKNLSNDQIKKKITLATVSQVNKTSFNEILKREEVKQVLASDRITREMNLVEGLMKEISDDGKVSYGFKDTENAVNSGAVDILLVTDSLIQKLRSEDIFDKLEQLMKTTDSLKAKIHIISSKHEGGKKLDGLGGIGALLRYKL